MRSALRRLIRNVLGGVKYAQEIANTVPGADGSRKPGGNAAKPQIRSQEFQVAREAGGGGANSVGVRK